MTSSVVASDCFSAPTSSKIEQKARWPLAFRLQLPKQQQGQQSLQSCGVESNKPAKKSWWSPRQYRGPNNESVQILYSKTIQDSEKIASEFLNEDVVGFDMEWPWNDWKKSNLQNKIGLIQLASETKIGLFHIGLHEGKTTNDIIAPSLRKIIEDPKIGKLGVGVLNADFARLHRYFRLNPKGAVELSHLYRLVKFGSFRPELVSTKMVSLARLVEDQLGHPLYKGDVRTSNWSRPLSRDQINYAAGDAYAGLMLYHCMNYKRLKMRPTPPMPIYAEKYLVYKMSGVRPLRLDAKLEDGSMMTSEAFFGVTMEDNIVAGKAKAKEKKKETPEELKLPKELIDTLSQELYKKLLERRANLAQKGGVPVYRITTNPVLVSLAIKQPTTIVELGAIKGVGPKQRDTYGEDWLQVISSCTTTAITNTPHDRTDAVQLETHSIEVLKAQQGKMVRRRRQGSKSSDSSEAFQTPQRRQPLLHTGLSFSLAETRLAGAAHGDDGSDASDDTLPSLDFGELETQRSKRQRTQSPSKQETSLSEQQEIIKDHTSDTLFPITGPNATAQKSGQVLPPKECMAAELRIARNKLQAFSKLVTRKIADRPASAPPILSDRTLSLIIVRAPQTQIELERIPGIDSFLLACQQTQTDLLKNIIKFTSPQIT